jgi:hypothetical protein
MQLLTLIPNKISILLYDCLIVTKIARNVWFLLKNHKKPLKTTNYESNVSPAWATFPVFFSDIFLPFCRGEKVVQHITNSVWLGWP